MGNGLPNGGKMAIGESVLSGASPRWQRLRLANVTPMVFARNLAGTEATATFWFKLFPKKFRTRDFPIDDALIAKLVNQIDPGGTLAPGPDMLSRFLKINGEMRRHDNQQLADLRFKTEEKILWNGPFLHWGKEESMFADARNYMYKGKQVDHQEGR